MLDSQDLEATFLEQLHGLIDDFINYITNHRLGKKKSTDTPMQEGAGCKENPSRMMYT